MVRYLAHPPVLILEKRIGRNLRLRSTIHFSGPRPGRRTVTQFANVPTLDLSEHRCLRNLPAATLIEYAVAAGEGRLASNGALVTGPVASA